MVHCDIFEKWTKETFLSGKKVGSRVLSRSQGEQVKSFLSRAAPAKDVIRVACRARRVLSAGLLGILFVSHLVQGS